MTGDGRLVCCLVERLTARGDELLQDEVAVISRTTLIQVSAASIGLVLELLVSLLEELSRPYGSIDTHPPHVQLSELYVLALAADCCTAHRDERRSNGTPLEPLGRALVHRTFDYLKILLGHLPDHGRSLPARTILDETTARDVLDSRFGDMHLSARHCSSSGSEEALTASRLPEQLTKEVEPNVQAIVDFLTASSWLESFDFFRSALKLMRSSVVAQPGMAPPPGVEEEQTDALVVFRVAPLVSVDSPRALASILQEICSSFLHLRKTYQTSIASLVPLLITRFLDRRPDEFVRLHNQHRKLEGGADTLFDMTQTIRVDKTGKKSQTFHPLQTALLLLIPEVFEVASNLREAKSSSMSRKVQFLDGLRQALRNQSEVAAYCLVCLLRAARHFETDSDVAILSYAMDVQDEVREAVFRRSPAGSGDGLFSQDLTTAAFISLIELNLEGNLEPLTKTCMHAAAPLAFKIALTQGCGYFARQQNSDRYHSLFMEVTPWVNNQMLTSAISADMFVEDQISQRRPSATSPAETQMACNTLNLIWPAPFLIFEHAPPGVDDKYFGDSFEAFASCLCTLNGEIRGLASLVAQRILSTPGMPSQLPGYSRTESPAWRRKFWRQTSLVILTICERIGHQDDAAVFTALKSYLECHIIMLNTFPALTDFSIDLPERNAASTKLETVLLVSLCSPDISICRLVTSCIGLFYQRCRLIDGGSASPSSAPRTQTNLELYSEMASPDFRFTGMVAFQKRARGLLRRMQYPSAGILDAWVTIFERWLHLSKEVSTHDDVDDKLLTVWRNYLGFLASLGGVCCYEQAYSLAEPSSELDWIDRPVVVDGYEDESLLGRYLRLSVQLLACHNVRVRQATREVLAADTCPPLFQPLFKALGAELELLFAGALEDSAKGQEAEVTFAEQAASLLRAVVERLELASELGAVSSIHIGSLALSFASFVDGIIDQASCLRLRIKICQLCEAAERKKDHLNLRDDLRIRNQLLGVIFGWIARPHHAESSGSRQEDVVKLQADLDRACLRSLAKVTYRLPLQPPDGQNDAGTSEVKSLMFQTYFNRFLSLLRHEPLEHAGSEGGEETTSELAITILSHLLSANIDVGLKNSLSIGYNEKVEIRTAFVKVLYNILVQGTEFGNLSTASVKDRYDELLALLTADVKLTMAICSVCQSSEVDELTVSLLNVFESRGKIFDLIEALITTELEQAETEAEILRRNCVATKLLSVYAKWKGSGYLRHTLGSVVERLATRAADLDLELDPARCQSIEEIDKNTSQLRIVAKVFIDNICASSADIPDSFRKICSIIATAVMPRFNEAKYTAVGAFVFLRFFCPAIVAPEAEGLLSEAPSAQLRRGLLLVAKVIQNLANNVLFGAKEPYMSRLNEFLTENIYRVTTFLRDISVPPETVTGHSEEVEAFNFGSCVSLHRFLYDHWDQVRQQLMVQERRHLAWSPSEPTGPARASEPIGLLIANLGPPPMSVTWNRPHISLNTPTAYSRFQHFMSQTAFRSRDSCPTSRAVYDGGESKDGLSVICVVPRFVSADSTDSGTLLYCFFKMVSRLWHRPFGLFIDATCSSGHSDVTDSVVRKLEELSPAELSKNLSRIYVYNMTASFRKCLRRAIRVASKSDSCLLNPRNVDYVMIDSMQSLQAHFHLTALHLPKETMDVVKDTQNTFKAVTRLSRSKGKIEVVLRVGLQYLQVTTSRKQDVSAACHLSSLVNDVFRLCDVDETSASSIDANDAFGLRTADGTTVMFFQTARKQELLHALRSAKAKYGKDPRTTKSMERLIRPQDVPGALLNLALANLAVRDAVLRLSAYNLLGALCRTFKLKAASRFITSTGVAVPLDPTHFIIGISRDLAQEEPQLTLDFLSEFFVGWDSFSEAQRPLSLAYMAPWIPGLRTSLLGGEGDGEKAREKIAAIFRKLIDLCLRDPALTLPLEHTVWPAIYGDEALLDIFLEEALKTAFSLGLHHEHTLVLASILTAMGTINLRGKLIARLRKALNKSSQRPTKSLAENAVWSDVCVLLQFCLSLSFDCGVQAQMYLPETLHIVTMLANTGPAEVRVLVVRLLQNTIHACCTSFNLDEGKVSKLRATLGTVSKAKSDIFISPPLRTTGSRDGCSTSPSLYDAGSSLGATENLALLLLDMCAIAAPSVDLANSWRSRWMSLVASTAFQNNPAIQPRAFTVMGCLAKEEVDDDLLYQVLVALRSAICRFVDDLDHDMLLSIVTFLAKMMAKLQTTSRYGVQLFWLAMSLVRLVPPYLFNCAGSFLEAVLTNIGTSTELGMDSMAALFLQGREPVEDVARALDDLYGIHFRPDNFHCAVCACLVRGLSDSQTKTTALRVLSTFVDMARESSSSSPSAPVTQLPAEIMQSPYMSLIQARAVELGQGGDTIWYSGLYPNYVLDGKKRGLHDLASLDTKELLLSTAIELVDFKYLEDVTQKRTLDWLREVALEKADVLMHLSFPISNLLHDLLLHCQNASTLESAHALFRAMVAMSPDKTAMASPIIATTDDDIAETPTALNGILGDMGLEGLWRSCSFHQAVEPDQDCLLLTEKLIELIIL